MLLLLAVVLIGTTANAQELTLGFAQVPLDKWLVPIGSGCLELNCVVIGRRPWDMTYRVKGVQLSRVLHPDISPLPNGSLKICNVDVERHSGNYRCEVSNSQGSRAFKEITVTRSALRQYVGQRTNQQTRTNTQNQFFSIRITAMNVVRTFYQGNRICIDISCTAEGTPTPLTYQFQYQNDPVPDPFLHEGITVSRNMLTSCGDSRCDISGEYKCIASNSLPRSESRTMRIGTQDPSVCRPTVRPTLPPPTTQPSGGLKLTMNEKEGGECCLVVECVSSARWTYILQGTSYIYPSRSRPQALGTKKVEICDINYSTDSGTYKCDTYAPRQTYQKALTETTLRQMKRDCCCGGNCGPQILVLQGQLTSQTQENGRLQEQLRGMRTQSTQVAAGQAEVARLQMQLDALRLQLSETQADLQGCRNILDGVRGLVRPCN